MKNNLLWRLTSRTFWITVGTIITLVAKKHYTEAAAVAISYILGEKAVDTFSSRPNAIEQLDWQKISSDDDEPNKDVIVTGKQPLFDEEDEKGGK